MEVGEELARRGHHVTVISPHAYKKVPPGVTEIAIKNTAFETFQNSLTDEMLTNPEAAPMPVFEVNSTLVN